MRVLGEGVAIEACIEDVSCASPRAGRHSMLETPWSLVICVRRVCPVSVRFRVTSHSQHTGHTCRTLLSLCQNTRPRTSRCHLRTPVESGSAVRTPARPPPPPLAETRDGAVKRARTAAHYRSTHTRDNLTQRCRRQARSRDSREP